MWIVEWLQDKWQRVTALFDDLWHDIYSFASYGYQNFKNWVEAKAKAVENWATWIWTRAQEIVQDAKNGLNAWIQSVSDWADAMFKSFDAWIVRVWNDLSSWIITAYNDAINWINANVGVITRWVEDLWNNIATWVTNIWNELVTSILSISDIVSGWLSDQWNSLTAWALEAIDNATGDLRVFYQDARETVYMLVNDPAGFILASIESTLYDWLANWLANLIERN
jgi:hypothetical protein